MVLASLGSAHETVTHRAYDCVGYLEQEKWNVEHLSKHVEILEAKLFKQMPKVPNVSWSPTCTVVS